MGWCSRRKGAVSSFWERDRLPLQAIVFSTVSFSSFCMAVTALSICARAASRFAIRSDLLASKFINCLMLDGKKTVAQNVFYQALEEISTRVADVEPLEVFKVEEVDMVIL